MNALAVLEAMAMTARSDTAEPSTLIDTLLDQIERTYGERPLGTYVRVARAKGGGLVARWTPPRHPRDKTIWDVAEEKWI